MSAHLSQYKAKYPALKYALSGVFLFLSFKFYVYPVLLAPSLIQAIQLFPLAYTLALVLLLFSSISALTFMSINPQGKDFWVGLTLSMITLIFLSQHVLGFIFFGLSHSFSLSQYQESIGYKILRQVPSPDQNKSAVIINIPSPFVMDGDEFQVEIDYASPKRIPQKITRLYNAAGITEPEGVFWKSNHVLSVMGQDFQIQ